MVPVEIHSVAQLDANGDFAGVHGSARDISERERLERELRESEVRYRYLVQSSPDLVWMTDDVGRLTFVSDQSGTILGWEPEELIGRSFSELAPPEERRGALARFRALRTRPHEVHRTRLQGAEPRRPRARDGDHQHRDGPGRRVHRRPRRGPRRQRARPARAGHPAPGGGARLVGGAVAPRPGAARLGDPGAVLDDAALAQHRAAAGQGPVPGPGQARVAARAPARGAGRDAGADLRAPPRQRRGERADPGAAHAQRGAVGPDRPAGRGGGGPRGPPVARLRRGPLPHRAGGAAQRRQARGREAGAGRGRAGCPMASTCA